VVERVDGAGRQILAHAEVGVDVAAAKGVDRLLGIADQDQCPAVLTVGQPVAAPDLLEDAPLAAVGVLELVDQRHRPLRLDPPRQAIAVRSGQPFVHLADQGAETGAPGAPKAHGNLRAHEGDGFRSEPSRHRFLRVFAELQPVPQAP
jgi:hypothetical protein